MEHPKKRQIKNHEYQALEEYCVSLLRLKVPAASIAQMKQSLEGSFKGTRDFDNQVRHIFQEVLPVVSAISQLHSERYIAEQQALERRNTELTDYLKTLGRLGDIAQGTLIGTLAMLKSYVKELGEIDLPAHIITPADLMHPFYQERNSTVTSVGADMVSELTAKFSGHEGPVPRLGDALFEVMGRQINLEPPEEALKGVELPVLHLADHIVRSFSREHGLGDFVRNIMDPTRQETEKYFTQ